MEDCDKLHRAILELESGEYLVNNISASARMVLGKAMEDAIRRKLWEDMTSENVERMGVTLDEDEDYELFFLVASAELAQDEPEAKTPSPKKRGTVGGNDGSTVGGNDGSQVLPGTSSTTGSPEPETPSPMQASTRGYSSSSSTSTAVTAGWTPPRKVVSAVSDLLEPLEDAHLSSSGEDDLAPTNPKP